jgi:PilZ domain
VTGPFDGRRHGAIDTPVVIHNLSESGCFLDSLFHAEAGRQLSLGVSVPDEGWITVKAEVVRGQPGFGFAVRFVEMPDATRACLARVVASRTVSVAPDVAPQPMTASNAW